MWRFIIVSREWRERLLPSFLLGYSATRTWVQKIRGFLSVTGIAHDGPGLAYLSSHFATEVRSFLRLGAIGGVCGEIRTEFGSV